MRERDDGAAMGFTVTSDSGITLPALEAASAIFRSTGKTLVCLDASFRVVFASDGVDEILGSGASVRMRGTNFGQYFFPVLFDRGGPLRAALEAGEQRGGWRAMMRTAGGDARTVSISAAPVRAADTRPELPIRYVILLESSDDAGGGPIAFSGVVARSRLMTEIFELVDSLRSSDAPIFISGEPGTGKSLIARAIHEHSPRSRGRFVTIACGAIPPQLIGSELFGSSAGEAPDAGRIVEASEGTLFLQDVEKLPVEAQTRLLRIIEGIGYGRDASARFTGPRVIAASTADLRRAIQEGRFREDLYYRLRLVPIEVPALRNRREDLELLSRMFLSRASAHQGRALRLSPEAIRAIVRYDWPKNAPELEAAIEHAAAVATSSVIRPEDLPPEIQHSARQPSPAGAVATPEDAPESLRIRNALEATRWRREEAARVLGISRTTLWRKMREHGLL